MGAATAQRIRTDIRSRFPDEFILVVDILRFAWGFGLPNPYDSRQHTFAALLFIKIRNDYQAVVRLTELGLCLQGETLLRGLLEAIVHLHLVCTDSAYVQEFENSQLVHRRRVLRAALDGEYPGITTTDVQWAEEQYAQLQREIAQSGRRPDENAYALFERAGWVGAYQSHYRALCLPAHSHVLAIDRYIGQSESSELTLLIGPIGDGIPYALSVAMHWLLQALRDLAHLTGTELAHDFRDLERRLRIITEGYPEAYSSVFA